MGATLGMAALQTSEYFGTGRDPVKLGSAHPRNAPYQAFRAKDGYFAMAAGNDRLWKSVCRIVGKEELEKDERFASTSLRAKNQVALKEILETSFSEKPVADWLKLFADAGVPCAPINSYSQALADPQVEHMGWVQPVELPGGAKTRTFVSPLKMRNQRFGISRRPPALGEHNEEVLEEFAHGKAR